MDFEVYCDESRQDLFRSRAPGENYVLIGGIWIKAEARQAHKQAIRELRERHNLPGEFKWNRVSPSRLNFYTDLVRLFFEREMRFRVIVLRADELDATKFHQSDEELMFYKFYYQLLHHWVLDNNGYRFFLDTKTNRVHGRIETLRDCLANANITSTVDVQVLPSHELDLIQLAVVLIGAVGYKLHGTSTSEAKLAVVAEIERRLRRQIGPTLKSEEKFNVFRCRPGGGW